MEKPKKILILYTSHTTGHKTIAENIGYYLSHAGYEVKLEDILQVQTGGLVTATRMFHYFVNKFLPFIWRWLYTSKWFTRTTLPYRLRFAKNNHLATLQLIEEFEPDTIITTQTTASGVVAFLKQQNLFTGKFGIAFSDFHLHRFWLYNQADFYLANTEEQKQEMLQWGIAGKKIFVCGMLLKPKPVVDSTAVKEKFGITALEKTILVSSGSLGFGIDEELLDALSQKTSLKVLVVTGNNEQEYKKLQQKFAGTNIIPLGFYTPMAELYAIADIFVGKPGGLSVSEALAWQLPILVTYVMPGQEELNYEYLLDKGLIMTEPVAAAGDIIEELERHTFRNGLAQNSSMQAIAPKPDVLLMAVKEQEIR